MRQKELSWSEVIIMVILCIFIGGTSGIGYFWLFNLKYLGIHILLRIYIGMFMSAFVGMVMAYYLGVSKK